MIINVLIIVVDNSQCMSLSQVPDVCYLNPQQLQRSKCILLQSNSIPLYSNNEKGKVRKASGKYHTM